LLADYNNEYKAHYELCKTLPEGVEKPPYPKVNVLGRKKKLNALKKEDLSLKTLMDTPYVILQMATNDLDSAFQRYFKAKKSGDVVRKIAEAKAKSPGKYARYIAKSLDRGKVGQQLDPFYPRFKSRFDDNKFSLMGNIKIESGRIKLPVIGWVKVPEKDYIPTNPVKICYASISQAGGAWWVSVTMKVDYTPSDTLQPVTLGVAVGISNLASTSTGSVYPNPKALAKFERTKKHIKKELSRRSHEDEKGKIIRGKNWKKTRAKLSRIERKIAAVRRYHQHNTSRAIVDTLPEKIVLSSIDIKKLVQDSPIAKQIHDAGMFEVQRQIEYKAAWEGIEVIKVKEGAPVARTCSTCGSEHTVYRSGYTVCLDCDARIHSGINTALNLEKKG